MSAATKHQAPYRHADGSDCYTKNCSRNVQNEYSTIEQFLAEKETTEKGFSKLTLKELEQRLIFKLYEELPDKKFVHDKLRILGNSLLRSPYKQQWSEENPSLGYCYVVSEAFYHYSNLEDKLTPYVMSFPNGTTHWFLRTSDGKIIDYTADQFPFKVDYSKATRCPFFKGGVETSKGFISKRGQQVAELLELV